MTESTEQAPPPCDTVELRQYTLHPGNFPRLPVREGEHVRVGLAMFDDATAFDAFVRSGTWIREAQPLLEPWLARAAQTHRWVPTTRSALHA